MQATHFCLNFNQKQFEKLAERLEPSAGGNPAVATRIGCEELKKLDRYAMCSTVLQVIHILLKLVLAAFVLLLGKWRLDGCNKLDKHKHTGSVFHTHTHTHILRHTCTHTNKYRRTGKCTKLPLVNQQSRRRKPQKPFDFPAPCMLCISLSGSWIRYV